MQNVKSWSCVEEADALHTLACRTTMATMQEGGNPFQNLLGDSSSSLAPTNAVGDVAQLPAPQPSDVDEKGNLPQKAPGEELKLPEQPKPEGPNPEQLGKVQCFPGGFLHARVYRRIKFRKSGCDVGACLQRWRTLARRPRPCAQTAPLGVGSNLVLKN